MRVKVRESEEEVVWHGFEHEHRRYTYGGLEFHFERSAYEAQVKKLEQWKKSIRSMRFLCLVAGNVIANHCCS